MILWALVLVSLPLEIHQAHQHLLIKDERAALSKAHRFLKEHENEFEAYLGFMSIAEKCPHISSQELFSLFSQVEKKFPDQVYNGEFLESFASSLIVKGFHEDSPLLNFIALRASLRSATNLSLKLVQEALYS